MIAKAAQNLERRLVKSVRKSVDVSRPDQVASYLIDILSGRFQHDWAPSGRWTLKQLNAVSRAYSRTRFGAKSKGAFYTPGWVAERLVGQVTDFGWPSDHVLDPSCGGGSLLLAAISALNPSRVTGWDTDRSAVRLAKALLEYFCADQKRSVEIDLRCADQFEAVASVGNIDLVLTNPPYGTELNGCAKAFAETQRLCGREPDKFALSLELLLSLSCPIAAVVPDVIRMQPEYEVLRRYLTKEHPIDAIDNLEFGSFPEATVQPTLLFIGRKSNAELSVRFSSPTETATAVSREAISSDRLCRWRRNVGLLQQYWDADHRPLGEIAQCHEGVHTGNIREKLFTSDANVDHARPLLKGADVTPFAFDFRGRYVRYDKGLIDRSAGEYASLRDPDIFEGPKLFSRQTSDRLVVCYDDGNLVSDNTLHSIKVRQGETYTLEWLALYLNSSLATALYRFESGEENRPLPQIKLVLLKQLPVPRPKNDKEAEALFRETAEAASTGALDDATMRRIDGFVVDSFCGKESDISPIIERAMTKPVRTQRRERLPQ